MDLRTNEQDFVQDLLSEIHNMRMTIDALRREIALIRSVHGQRLGSEDRATIRQIIRCVEVSRGVESLTEKLGRLRNLPCLLYCMGAVVPLPRSAQDREWSWRWSVWVDDSCTSKWLRQSVDVEAFALNPNAEETYVAKLDVYDTILPYMALCWWERLRRWAQLPEWKASPNLPPTPQPGEPTPGSDCLPDPSGFHVPDHAASSRPSEQDFVQDLLSEIHTKQLTVNALRRESTLVRAAHLERLERENRATIRQVICCVEVTRGVKGMSEAAHHIRNLPCLLYCMGAMVPLPRSAQDSGWTRSWSLWIEDSDNSKWLTQSVNAGAFPLKPSAEETYLAKLDVYDTVLPHMALCWWEHLRRWAELPEWKSSPNKMSG